MVMKLKGLFNGIVTFLKGVSVKTWIAVAVTATVVTTGAVVGVSLLGHEHAYGEWVITQEATCTQTGVQYRTCECGEEERKNIPASGHKEGDWVVDIEPTCVEEGSKSKRCTVCSAAIKNVSVDKLGHDYDTEWTIDTEPTCTTNGSKSHHCSRCEVKKDVTKIPANSHSDGEWITDIDPTCTESGSKHQICSVCNDTIATDVIAPLGHSFGEWTETLAPTCTEEGKERRDCEACDYYITMEIDSLGHKYGEWTETLAPTCTEEGSERRNCKACEYYETTGIDALGHSLGEWVQTLAPTITEKGSERRDCDACEYFETRDIDALCPYYVTIHQNISDAGSVSGEGNYAKNSSVTVNATTNAGYTFLGWYEDGFKVSSKASYTFTLSVSNKTLEARWQINNYSVSVAQNLSAAGTVSGNGDYAYGSTVTLEAITNAGYTFLGWYENGSEVSSNTSYTFTLSANNKTLEARWQINNYSISLTKNIAEGGDVSGSGSYTYGNSITVTAKTNVGYIFLGWYENDILISLTEEYTFDISENRVLCAQWSLVYYTITYECANDVNIDNMPSMYTIKDEAFPLNPQSKDHYTFHWEIDNNVVNFFDTSMAKNIVVKGIWTLVEYQITYDLDGGIGTNRTTYNIETGEFALSEPTKDGYTFIGWTGSNGETPQKNIIVSNNTPMPLFYVAHWEITVYGIQYHLNSGENHQKNPTQYTLEDTIELKAPTKAGYTFNGWYTNAEMTEAISSIVNMIGDLELYAKFSPNSYSYSFNDNTTLILRAAGFDDIYINIPYNQVVDPYSYEIMSNFIPDSANSSCSSNDPNFSGWYFDSSYTAKVNGALTIQEDTILYCHFNNSSPVMSMFSGSYISKYSNEDVNNSYRVPTLSNGKLTIEFWVECYDQWINGNYIYSTYFGGTIYIINVTQNKTLYYTRWSGKEYHSREWAKITVDVNPGDVIRCYNGSDGHPNTGTYASVTYSIDGRMTASVVSSKSTEGSILYDDIIANPTHHEKRGYDFTGWVDSNNNIVSGMRWNYLENQTFFPSYSIKSYDINYILNDGINNPNNPQNYTVNDNITLSSPYKQGYTFEGWYLDENYNTKIERISNMIGGLTLYAKFSVNTYNLSMDGMNGIFAPKIEFISENNVIRTEYLFGDETIEKYYPQDRDGYIFGGWYTDSNFENIFNFDGVISEDKKLYAKWIKTSANIINIETIT